MKIEKLTKEQELRFPEFVKTWTDIGLCTKRADRKKAEQACRDAYVVAGLEPPKMIFWAESPVGLLMAAKLVKEISKKGFKPYSEMDLASVLDSVGASVRASVWASVWASVRDSVLDSVWDSVMDSVLDSVAASVLDSVGASVRASVWASVGASVRASVWASVWASELKKEWDELNSWGQHDANWLGFYDYFREVCDLSEETKKLIPLSELSKETGWHLFYKDVAFLSEKPIEIKRNTQGQLSNLNGYAIKWADGYELYRIDGVRLDGNEWITTEPIEKITREKILSIENVDARRCLIKRIGIEKTIQILGAEIVDTYESKVGGKYELLLVDYDGRGKRPYLKMSSQSIEADHIEGVPTNCRTVKEALMFRNQTKIFIEPEMMS